MRENEQFQRALNAILDALAEIQRDICDLRDNSVQKDELFELQAKLEMLEQRVGDHSTVLFGSEFGAPNEQPDHPTVNGETGQILQSFPQQEEVDQAIVKLIESTKIESGLSEDVHIFDEQLQMASVQQERDKGLKQPHHEQSPRAQDIVEQSVLREELEDKPTSTEPMTTEDIPTETESPPIATTVKKSRIRGPWTPEPAEPPPPRPPKPPPRKWNWADIEWLAVVWGIRIGVFILVVGLGYLLSIGFAKLGLFGKAMVVYAACLGMWCTGLVFERLERYRTWARIMIGGGWAGIYITTFLIHYLPEARLIADPSVDTMLLMLIAAGMIIHSFRYSSESLTSLAYFVAFITISLSIHLAQETFFSLIATTILAASMVFILYRMQWYWLALFCIVACYGTHAVWAHPLISSFRSPDGHVMEYWSGLCMLVLYWTTFTVGVCLTKPENRRQDTLSLWMVALNFALFVAVFRYHVGTQHPELRWYFSGVMAIAYGVLGYLAYTWNRWNIYTLNLVLAVLCTTMTLYFKFLGGNWVTLGWLIQAEALWIAGLLAAEKRFRWIAIVNFFLVVLYMFAKDFFLTEQLSLFGVEFYKRTAIFGAVALAFFANAIFLRVMEDRVEKEDLPWHLFSYAGSGIVLILLLRNWFPDGMLKAAVAGSVLGLVLSELGKRIKDLHLGAQGIFFVFLGVLSALLPLSDANSLYYTQGFFYRIGCEAIAIIIAYLAFYRAGKLPLPRQMTVMDQTIPAVFSAVAVIVCALFIYREIRPVDPVWIALGWTTLGILFVELGLSRRSIWFRSQGYFLVSITILWSLYCFFFQPEWFDRPAVHFVCIGIVVALLYYVFARFFISTDKVYGALTDVERKRLWENDGPLSSVIFAAAGTLVLLLLLRQELVNIRPLFIAVSWLGVSIGLLEVGVYIGSRTLRAQAFVVSSIAFGYALTHNLVPGNPIGPFSGRLLTLVLCVSALYYMYERIYRGEQQSLSWADMPHAYSALSWFASVLLVLVILYEVWMRWPAWVGTVWLIPILVYLLMGVRRKCVNFAGQCVALSASAFVWTLFVTIPPLGTGEILEIMRSHRLFSVLPIIAVFYTIFLFGLRYEGLLPKLEKVEYIHYARDGFSWAASILLVCLLAAELSPISSALTTIVWVGLAVLLVELGFPLESTALKYQGCLLAVAATLRAVSAYSSEDIVTAAGLATTASAAGLYYLFVRLRQSDNDTPLGVPESTVGQSLTYPATMALGLLIYYQVQPNAWIPPAWAGLMCGVLGLGILLGDRHPMYQAMCLVVPIAIGVWVLDFPWTGEFLGRITAGLAIAGLFAAKVLWHFGYHNRRDNLEDKFRGLQSLDGLELHVFSLPAAAMLFLLIFNWFSGDLSKYLTLAWACEAFLLMILGFVLTDQVLRFTGLGLLAVCIAKVFYDLWMVHVHRAYKVVALIGLGAILIVTGWIYSRYRSRIMELIRE